MATAVRSNSIYGRQRTTPSPLVGRGWGWGRERVLCVRGGGLAPAGPKSGQASDWKVVELTAGPTTDASDRTDVSDRKVVSPTKGQTGRRS